MINLYDVAYGIGLAAAALFWLVKPSARRKVLRALRERMGDVPHRIGGEPAVLIHAVSLGEINATRALVRALADARPELHFIVSTTTDTGYTRGQELYGSNSRVTLIRYPLDFTGAIIRMLDRLKPSLVVLMELEVWPNFAYQCERREIPIALINGRLTGGSFRNYRLGGWLVRRMFRRLAAVCAQEQTYAERFIALGAVPDRVQVTGTMKFDTAQIADRIAGADELANDLGLRPGNEPIWVCGSTGSGEEEILLAIYRKLLGTFPTLRLVLVPRKPERFDEVADLIRGDAFEVIRRSVAGRAAQASAPAEPGAAPPVILGDTMGELRKFYSLADVVFVGRTLVDLGARQHGSDMIEPAALGKPTVVGHYIGNFAEVMNFFRSHEAIREIVTANNLHDTVADLLTNRDQATSMGSRAKEVVRESQGATTRHATVILALLDRAHR